MESSKRAKHPWEDIDVLRDLEEDEHLLRVFAQMIQLETRDMVIALMLRGCDKYNHVEFNPAFRKNKQGLRQKLQVFTYGHHHFGIPKPEKPKTEEDIAAEEKAKIILHPNHPEHPDNQKPEKRNIENPHSRIKVVQKAIKDHILPEIPVSEACTAYEPGMHAIKNAQRHKYLQYLLSVDVRRAYESIRAERIWEELSHELDRVIEMRIKDPSPNLRHRIKVLFMMLTTYNDHIPTGSITGPGLLNRAYRRLDENILETIPEDAVFTRYADNFDISSEWYIENPEHLLARIIYEITKFDVGEIHPNKTQIWTPSTPLSEERIITGVAIDTHSFETFVPKAKMRRYIKFFRRILKYPHTLEEKYLDEEGNLRVNKLLEEVDSIFWFVTNVEDSPPLHFIRLYIEIKRTYDPNGLIPYSPSLKLAFQNIS